MKISSRRNSTKIFFKEELEKRRRERHKNIRCCTPEKKRGGKIFGSIDSSFILIESTGGVLNDNIEEPNTFGYLITPEKNIEEPEKWVVPSAEQRH